MRPPEKLSYRIKEEKRPWSCLMTFFLCNTRTLDSHVQKNQPWMTGNEPSCLPSQTNTGRKCIGGGATDICPWKNTVILFEGVVWGCSRDQGSQGTKTGTWQGMWIIRIYIFYMCVIQRRNTNYIVLSLINRMGYLVTLTWKRLRNSSISLPQFSMSAKSINHNSVAEEWSRTPGLRPLQEPAHI